LRLTIDAMTHEPVVSGKRLVKVLEGTGWERVRQHGDHVMLRKAGERQELIVPLHHELKKGTEAGILREAGLHPDDLRRALGQ
jgi:predicted RNA binding protein YcfA (HicA-like mRNA interferase family)